ncbi:putative dehydratase [Yersinia frederiksenii]|uniref:FabA-like domain protein n=2 Tax=Yersinia frederiksenii TaxID=29484 RepID=A0ABR4W7Y0_YERFR|nr:hotdog family protein [Yersinia frederiksenii]ATM94743.1 3-hydroxy-fatty acyl-ACP dehydratase [Yersinia frederiksenii]KGA48818.1 fabA-like domain protein [Yersinia frederiksenii ATCC 33641]CFR13833.1 putative dehydratase [Yersinia frederiksenii]CND12339.1 putative dehydratase [Yersinia frederiksenii]SUP76725.1 putative dehydratase [Yersinia frederiksenii]
MANFAENYLPHQSPMVMLDELCSVGKEDAECRVTLSEDGVLAPFLDADGCLPNWFAIELMAQTIGVWRGWHGLEQAMPPSIGMLLGGRAISCELPVFPAGSELRVYVHLILQDEKMGSFECSISIAGKPVARGRLNTYQPDSEEIKKLTLGKGA